MSGEVWTLLILFVVCFFLYGPDVIEAWRRKP